MTDRLILALLILMALPIISAAKEYTPLVFNKSISAGATISLDYGDFTFDVGTGNVTSVIIIGDNLTAIIKEHECKRLNYEHLCHHRKVDSTKAVMVLTDLRAHLDVSLTTDYEEKVEAGTPINAYLWINNTGLNRAEKILVELSTQNVTITDLENCRQNTTHIYWEGEISADDAEYCSFVIRPQTAVRLEKKAQATYTTYDQQRQANSTAVTMISTMPLDLTITTETDPLSLEPDQDFRLTLLINNTIKENITIGQIEITYGKDAELVGKSALFTTRSQSVRMNGFVLEPGHDVQAWIDLKVPDIDMHGDLNAEILYTTQDDDENKTLTRTIPYATNQKNLTIWTTPTEAVFEELQKATINVSISNPYKDLAFKGYDATISSDLIGKDIITRVPYERTRLLATLTFIAPTTAKTLTKHILVSVIARTDSQEQVIIEKTIPVIIHPLQGIHIEHSVAEEGESSTISVYATNNHHQSITAKFDEAIPEQTFISGNTRTTLTLESKNKTLIYSYEVIPAATGTYTFTTSYSYDYSNNNLAGNVSYVTELQKTATNPLVPAFVSNTTTSNSTQLPPQEQQDTLPQINWLTIGITLLLIALAAGLKLFWKHKPKQDKKVEQTITLETFTQTLEDIKKEKSAIKQEEQQITDKIRILKSHLAGYQHNLPLEMEKINKERERVQALLKENKNRKDTLAAQMALLQEQEKKISAGETQLANLTIQLDTRQEAIRKDEMTLKQDIESLTKELTIVQDQLKEKQLQKEKTETELKNTKATHAQKIKKQLLAIRQKREQSRVADQELSAEEKKLQEEFKKIALDLKASETDMRKAEKIFKEVADASRDEKK